MTSQIHYRLPSKTKKDLLIILNPRNYKPSIKSLKSLNIPKVWITGYPEKEALYEVNKIVAKGGYENYILQADDVIVKQEQIDIIVNNNDTYDILSGYCCLSPQVRNINVAPVQWGKKITLNGKRPTKKDYPFYSKNYTYENLHATIKGDIFETYSIGFSFTSFKKHVLQEYCLEAYDYQGGIASDHHISYRIITDGKYKMYVHKDCFFEHLKLKMKYQNRHRAITWDTV